MFVTIRCHTVLVLVYSNQVHLFMSIRVCSFFFSFLFCVVCFIYIHFIMMNPAYTPFLCVFLPLLFFFSPILHRTYEVELNFCGFCHYLYNFHFVSVFSRIFCSQSFSHFVFVHHVCSNIISLFHYVIIFFQKIRIHSFSNSSSYLFPQNKNHNSSVLSHVNDVLFIS